MNNIDKEILNAIQSVCDEEGVPEVTDMILSLIENFYEDEKDNTNIDLIIQNLLEALEE